MSLLSRLANPLRSPSDPASIVSVELTGWPGPMGGYYKSRRDVFEVVRKWPRARLVEWMTDAMQGTRDLGARAADWRNTGRDLLALAVCDAYYADATGVDADGKIQQP